jgi:hypothetical protein
MYEPGNHNHTLQSDAWGTFICLVSSPVEHFSTDVIAGSLRPLLDVAWSDKEQNIDHWIDSTQGHSCFAGLSSSSPLTCRATPSVISQAPPHPTFCSSSPVVRSSKDEDPAPAPAVAEEVKVGARGKGAGAGAVTMGGGSW